MDFSRPLIGDSTNRILLHVAAERGHLSTGTTNAFIVIHGSLWV